jgi:hypothetical protein
MLPGARKQNPKGAPPMFALERTENFRTSPLPVTAQLLVPMMHPPQVDASVDIQLP